MLLNLNRFLKTEDVKAGDIIMIMDGGIPSESKKFTNPDGTPKVQLNFTVKMGDGSEMCLSMNKTSQKMLAQAFGRDTDKWVGKVAKINLSLTPMGKQMIILEPLVDKQ